MKKIIQILAVCISAFSVNFAFAETVSADAEITMQEASQLFESGKELSKKQRMAVVKYIYQNQIEVTHENAVNIARISAPYFMKNTNMDMINSTYENLPIGIKLMVISKTGDFQKFKKIKISELNTDTVIIRYVSLYLKNLDGKSSAEKWKALDSIADKFKGGTRAMKFIQSKLDFYHKRALDAKTLPVD